MASQEYIGYLYEAQAELVLQRITLVELNLRKAWESFPSVHADVKAKAVIIENMLNHYEPPKKKRSTTRWQRLTKIDSGDVINDNEDLVIIAVTAVSTILNEVEMMIDRHIPSNSPFLFSKMQDRSLSVHWGRPQTRLFTPSHAPAWLFQSRKNKPRETEARELFPDLLKTGKGRTNDHRSHIPNPLRLC